MATSATYSPEYFAAIRNQSRISAAAVAPMAIELLHPRSVVDVGCGTGAWAAAFKALGVVEILGIDGGYVDCGELDIEPGEFLAADLTQTISLPRTFDLAVCLEVAEHLDEQHAEQLVASLTQFAPAVLFSAAIPFQGGQHHVNEQWPAYWIQQFVEHEYVATDPFRLRIWQDESVAWWYAQNLLLFMRRDAMDRFPDLAVNLKSATTIPALVHPACALQFIWQNQVLQAAIELIGATSAHSKILLVDESRFGEMPPLGRELWPFTEMGGIYQGPPADSQMAIAELEDKRHRGANYMAFAWPSFWWLEYYSDFASYLRRRYSESHRSDRWVVFRL